MTDLTLADLIRPGPGFRADDPDQTALDIIRAYRAVFLRGDSTETQRRMVLHDFFRMSGLVTNTLVADPAGRMPDRDEIMRRVGARDLALLVIGNLWADLPSPGSIPQPPPRMEDDGGYPA